MKITHYLPPKGPNFIAFSCEQGKGLKVREGEFLDSDGVITEITSEQQLQEIQDKQKAFYEKRNRES